MRSQEPEDWLRPFPHHPPISLTKMTRYADKTTYGASTQRDRHQHLLRQVRGKVACAQGQERTDGSRTLRVVGDTEKHVATLGMWGKERDSRRISRSCEITRCFDSRTVPERVKVREFGQSFGKFLCALGTDFCGKNRKNHAKYSVFLCAGHVHGENSLFSAKNTDSPYCKTANAGYNMGITVGNSPNQNGLPKWWNTLITLTTVTKSPSRVASANYTRLVFSSSDHDATKEGRTLS